MFCSQIDSNYSIQIPVKELILLFIRRYNKVGDGTLANLVPILTGKYVEDIPWNESSKKPFDYFPFMWKNFSDKG